MSRPYDSTADTLAHIERVRHYLAQVEANLRHRADVHDASKLVSPEKEVFDRVTPKLRSLTYGSPEYRASLREMGKALQHHYQHNSHHPEHFGHWECNLCFTHTAFDDTLEPPDVCRVCGNGGFTLRPHITGMSLFDLLEMLADWRAATERHANGNMADSLAKNIERFEIGNDLKCVLINTLREIGWIYEITPSEAELKVRGFNLNNPLPGE